MTFKQNSDGEYVHISRGHTISTKIVKGKDTVYGAYINVGKLSLYVPMVLFGKRVELVLREVKQNDTNI